MFRKGLLRVCRFIHLASLHRAYFSTAFYMCGLEDDAAVEAARAISARSQLPTGWQPSEAGMSQFDNPSWMLYKHWLAQNPQFRAVETSTET